MEPKAFYGLRKMPFMKETRYTQPFSSEDVQNMTDRLAYLRKVKGIGVFTGPPGSGKTSIVEGYVKKLNSSLYSVIYIAMTTITATEFLRQLADGLGLEPRNRKCDIFKQVHETIENLAVERKVTPVIVIDEAQYLMNTVLNDIKMLINFDFDSKNRMILIFIGESGFNGILSRRVHDALRQRVVINYDMQGLLKSEAEAYVAHCLKECGCHEPVFSPEAINAAWEIGNGSVRKMNSVLEKALIEGANRQERPIGTDTILMAQQEVELG
ncbi:MAG: ExeA family protein [Candidatus Cryptobacteroides sp.]